MPESHRSSPHAGAAVVGRVITALLIVSPVAAIAVSVPLLWGHAIRLRDAVLAAILYAVTGHGVTVGFHRLFTHRGFTPKRPLKIALAVAGSMAIEGSVVSWVANHRRHHVHSDRSNDPHSPHTSRHGVLGPVRGFLHAHVGWMFDNDTTAPERYAADVLRDRDLTTVSTFFPLWAVASLALPFGAGWLWSGSLIGGLTAFVWAGIIRMGLLHHVTWSVNSICHMFGRAPSPPTTRAATSGSSPSSRSASRGTTCTTPTLPPPGTGSGGGRSTPRQGSFASSRRPGGPPTSGGRPPNGSPRWPRVRRPLRSSRPTGRTLNPKLLSDYAFDKLRLPRLHLRRVRSHDPRRPRSSRSTSSTTRAPSTNSCSASIGHDRCAWSSWSTGDARRNGS
jgi:fatty-acid desaturase